MLSFSFKSVLGHIGLFVATLVTGVSLVGIFSSAKDDSFDFGRGHRARDSKMAAELERMQDLNERLQERLEALEEKMNKESGLKAIPTVPPIPAAPSAPSVQGDAKQGIAPNVSAPQNAPVRQKSDVQASF